jgi:uncharacterized membrane protein HdeD (DUF308 family)
MAFGVALVVLGFVALVNVVDATLVATAIVGLVLAVAGLVQLVGAFMGVATLSERLLHIVIGILYLVVGVYTFVNPVSGAIALAFVIGVMLIAEGIIRIYGAFAWRSEYKWLHMILGGITILLGIWLISGIPLSGIVVGFFVGFGLLMAGFSWIALGWAVRSATRQSQAAAA